MPLCGVQSRFVNAAEHFVEVEYVIQFNFIHRAHTVCRQYVHSFHAYLKQGLTHCLIAGQVKLRAITRFRPLFLAA